MRLGKAQVALSRCNFVIYFWLLWAVGRRSQWDCDMKFWDFFLGAFCTWAGADGNSAPQTPLGASKGKSWIPSVWGPRFLPGSGPSLAPLILLFVLSVIR